MLICCTKKLQEQIGVKCENIEDGNDLFSWTANIVMINRRKSVVVVNDSSRFGFILYGLKAKDFKNFDNVVIDGIRKSLRSQKIKEEIIEAYLKDAGKAVYSKTRGRKYVSRLNTVCEYCQWQEKSIDKDKVYQSIMSRYINTDYVKIDASNKYEEPCNLLMQDFTNAYGEDIIQCGGIEILVKLYLGSYIAERRIVTPNDITFKDLHAIIQKSIPWNNNHIHEFIIFDEKDEDRLRIVSKDNEFIDMQEESKIAIESQVYLADYVDKALKIFYCYDFGDYWKHEVVIEGIVADFEKNYPICIQGSGDAPPEDVGGVDGYQEFLRVMADAEDPEYEDLINWARYQGYESFDIESANRRLKYMR
ncbi:plasmid pRiA4b ORF-3 family protein [Clostridium manihotivorum]|uniref:Plasmid pRiA4b ORF-3 family protein n=1 Tax=Clostridium manihotivorum TaxID=2320868 RepID=A0A410DSE8_9CLOT|nr:plasmid pRiA4b ORF-3 family protein [Clostridium manihotivorum]QAA32133.1 plasmid pRiA4b ORF-3 family protein [Clostridium manihotivorum]